MLHQEKWVQQKTWVECWVNSAPMSALLFSLAWNRHWWTERLHGLPEHWRRKYMLRQDRIRDDTARWQYEISTALVCFLSQGIAGLRVSRKGLKIKKLRPSSTRKRGTVFIIYFYSIWFVLIQLSLNGCLANTFSGTMPQEWALLRPSQRRRPVLQKKVLRKR